MASDARIILDIRRRCGALLSELDAGNYHEPAARMAMVVDALDRLVEHKLLRRTSSGAQTQGERRIGT
jgi:hypothetical protein